MSSKSRHASRSAAHDPYIASRNAVPRHQALPQSDMCFASATLDADMMNINYSLSSAARGSRHYTNPAWNASSGAGPAVDDYLPVSGYDSMSLSGSCYPMSMMPTPDAMDVTYGLAAGETMSRHAVLDPNMMIDDYSFMDFDQESAFMDGYLADYGSSRYLTPPPEECLHRYFDHGNQGRHMKPEPTVCENLGVSKLQAYRLGCSCTRYGRRLTHSTHSASRHSAGQPRPIRPSSERTEAHSSRRDSLDSRHSTKEDHDKVKARNDPRYDAKPDRNGLYHCPFNKGADKCNHQATKQKCIYS